MEEKKMEKLISGALFCLTAAVARSVKYLSAALYMAGNASQSRELFASGMRYIGSGPDVMASFALICGVMLLIWGIRDMSGRK